MRAGHLKWLLAVLGVLVVVRAAMFVVPWLLRPGPRPFPQAPADAVDRFADARFGLFIHWGPVAITGKEIGWSRDGRRPNFGGRGEIPVEVYDDLYKEFNPSNFDARRWVDIARSAGMGYLVFTAKHHDGFCMFDSRLSEYKVTRSPFGRDVTGEVAAACRDAGLQFGIYYSFADWHHPDYLTPEHGRYLGYMAGQVNELCTRYGPVDVFWFDSVGDSGFREPWFDPHRLFVRMRRIQPRMLINDRLGDGDFLVCEGIVCDYSHTRLFETCMPLGTQWSYKPDDRLKSADECIRLLVSCAGSGGNLLLGVGPTADGSIEPRQAAVLEEVGRWLARFGRSIHETRKGPVKPAAWGTCTRRGLRWYVHVLDWSQGPVVLDTRDYLPVQARVLTGGAADVKLTSAGIAIEVPPEDRDALDTIVEIDVAELDAPTASTQPQEPPP